MEQDVWKLRKIGFALAGKWTLRDGRPRGNRQPEMRRLSICRYLVAVVLLGSLALAQTWRLKASASVADGVNDIGSVVCGDVGPHGQPDFTFWRRGEILYSWLWRIEEYRSYGLFDLVQSETCVGNPYPDTGIHKGLFIPSDVGDIDGDGVSEYLGYNEHYAPGSIRSMVCLYEARDTGPEHYPDTLVWRYEYSLETDAPCEWYAGDMDRDGLPEVLATNTGYTYVFELRGNNQLDSVFRTPLRHCGYDHAIGDFDRDGATEFVFAYNGGPDWYVRVYECTGNDQYVLSGSFPQHGRLESGSDIVSGGDLDADGKPEFFIIYSRWNVTRTSFFICMYEAVADNQYECTVIDSLMNVATDPASRASAIGEVDGDSVPELLFSFVNGIRVYKATGNDRFQWVWQWSNPSPSHPKQSQIACYDMNRNGYQDIVISGNGHTWMYELEGIRLLAPNGGNSLVPGETYRIRWRLYTPPRCDSVSLFLRRDSTSVLDTIATGIAPSESSYNWVVPPGPVDSARIVAMAYGPGELFDESDTPFSILPGGCEEEPGAVVRNWALWVWPNPVTSQARVRFAVPQATSVSVTVSDAGGRVVRTLASGRLGPGSYERPLDADLALPAGVYMVNLTADGRRLSRKVVLPAAR